MSNRSLLILEIVWIITGILCVAAAIRFAIINGYSNRILILALMAFISFLFAWMRHRQRKKS
ncbi:MAG TPA: hypothetical protein VMW32_12200 [Bacteroidales bacterium]|nr:hypothetical protein [Bacteroidales bacterium]